MIQALNIAPGAHVAHLGASDDYFTFPLADAIGPEGKVYSVDVEEKSLRMIDKGAIQRRVVNIIETILATPNDPHLPPNGVDLIFTCNTYHHLHDRVAYFTSLSRYLRPEGRITVIDRKEGSWFGSLFGHTTAKETVQREMEAAGYRLVDDFGFLSKQHFQVFEPFRS